MNVDETGESVVILGSCIYGSRAIYYTSHYYFIPNKTKNIVGPARAQIRWPSLFLSPHYPINFEELLYTIGGGGGRKRFNHFFDCLFGCLYLFESTLTEDIFPLCVRTQVSRRRSAPVAARRS